MRRIIWGSTEDFFVRLSWGLKYSNDFWEKNLNFRAQIPWANDNESDLCQVYGGKNTVPLLSYHTVRKLCNGAYCELLHQLWTFFLSLSLAIARAAAVPVKPRVIVWRWWWPKWKFFFRRRLCRKSRPLLCYGQKSTTYGKGALLCVLHLGWRPIHFQWFQRAAATQSARKSFM